MADSFKQIEQLEARSYVLSRLEEHGLCVQGVQLTPRKVRYLLVSKEHNFVIKRDLTFRQVAAYVWQLDQEKENQMGVQGGN